MTDQPKTKNDRQAKNSTPEERLDEYERQLTALRKEFATLNQMYMDERARTAQLDFALRLAQQDD